MPTTTPTLDNSKAYVYCPVCRQQGNPSSPLQRDGHILRCALQHQVTAQQLQQTGADMIKSGELCREVPSPTDEKWVVWIHPEVRKKIESKFSGRVIVTVATLLAALADGSLVMITGEQAQKLKMHGVNNGNDMVAAVESIKELDREKTEAMQSIERFQSILKVAGVA